MRLTRTFHVVSEGEDGAYERRSVPTAVLKQDLAMWFSNGCTGSLPEGVTPLRTSNRIFVVGEEPDEGTLLYRNGARVHECTSAYAARRRTAHQAAAYDAERERGCTAERQRALASMKNAATRDCSVLTREIEASQAAFDALDARLQRLREEVRHGCIPVLRSTHQARFYPCRAAAKQFVGEDLGEVLAPLSTLRVKPFTDYRRRILEQAEAIECILLNGKLHNNRAIPAVREALNAVQGIQLHECLRERVEELHWLLTRCPVHGDIAASIQDIRSLVMEPLFAEEARPLDPEDPLTITRTARDYMGTLLMQCGEQREPLLRTLKSELTPLPGAER
ncbi:hypothetical protein COU80_06145 [Candidatus Peregrinibacteria bacterium CG10_big_fil_rev_8_21_14_0_10_55_24]|nr:MAG: hypothetical protein COU80_06145 [Candidatus Peregrinibacteria bacterium CG10_big_fil_rev_8_21_14_0_10_55_24]